jgi:uracil-DNA glycosylase
VGIDSLEQFARLLKKSPSGAVFNPWWQIDEENDIGLTAPPIRRKQLRAYLQERLANARFAIVGEALGYRGGHFSGIPMTSERMLLRKQPEIVAALCERRNFEHRADDDGRRPPLQIVAGITPRRTSKPEKCPDGFSEPTATIVWGMLLRLGLKPNEFVLWNAFPWHSFDSHRGMLSNRMPNKSERTAGLPVLKAFLELFPCDQVVALGKIAAAQLEEFNVNAHCIRHPASGGARLFRQQIAEIVNKGA